MPPKVDGKLETSIKINKLVAQYIAVRERMRKLKALYEEQLQPFKDAESKLSGVMLQFLEETGQESARTDAGTVYITERHTASLTDPDLFMEFVMKNGAFELMDRRANSTACRDHCEEYGSLPPGVKINSLRTVNVRST